MALKTAQVPLPRLTLAQWRTELGLAIGRAYSSLDSDAQTSFDRFLNETYDYISRRCAHEPWATEETTATLTAGTDTTYSLPAACRTVIDITEEGSTTTLRALMSTKREFRIGYGAGVSTHPWANSKQPVWFFDGFTDDAPPVQQWRRIGTSGSGNTARIMFHPFFGVYATSGEDAYPVLGASYVAMAREHFLEKWFRFKGDYEKAGAHAQAAERELASLEIADNETHEDPWSLGPDENFTREMR